MLNENWTKVLNADLMASLFSASELVNPSPLMYFEGLPVVVKIDSMFTKIESGYISVYYWIEFDGKLIYSYVNAHDVSDAYVALKKDVRSVAYDVYFGLM